MRRDLSERRAAEALTDFGDFSVERYSVTAWLPRVWSLRSALTPYDAAYVVLAEVLGGPLVTTNTRLARSHGHRAEILAP